MSKDTVNVLQNYQNQNDIMKKKSFNNLYVIFR